MNIFLTGASGFVGSHLLEKLINDGHSVTILVRDPAKIKINSPRLIIIKGNLESELNLSPIETAKIEVVIHSAGIVNSFIIEDFYKTNTVGTHNIIKHFSGNPNLKFILISSLAARGPGIDSLIDLPVSEYGKSKLQAEELLKSIAPNSWIKIKIRPPMVIGPRDPAILDIFKMVKSGFVLLPGIDSLDKEYSFVCVFDLVTTIANSISYNKSDTFYSSYQDKILFSDLISAIKKEMNKKIVFNLKVPTLIISIISKILFVLYKIKKHDLPLTPDKTLELFETQWVCSSKRTEELLSQQFHYNLERTVKITYKDYQSKNWI